MEEESEVVHRLGESRVQFQRPAEAGLGIGVPSSPAQRETEVVVRLRETRVDIEGRSEGSLRCLCRSSVMKRDTARIERHRVVLAPPLLLLMTPLGLE